MQATCFGHLRDGCSCTFSRRRALVCAGSVLLPKANVVSGSNAGGCRVDQRQLEERLPPQTVFASVLSMERLIPFSGDREFDKALGRQLVRLARAFAVRPGFAYADDFNGLNAAASSMTRVPDTLGTVAFGIRLLRDLLARGEGGDIAVLGICAHEFAHIHQFFSDDYARLSAAHQTAKLVELQADYLAGYFVGQVKRDRPRINLQKFGDFLFRSGAFDRWDPQFHGTPTERVRCAEEGFRQAAQPFATAAQTGRMFVLHNFR